MGYIYTGRSHIIPPIDPAFPNYEPGAWLDCGPPYDQPAHVLRMAGHYTRHHTTADALPAVSGGSPLAPAAPNGLPERASVPAPTEPERSAKVPCPDCGATGEDRARCLSCHPDNCPECGGEKRKDQALCDWCASVETICPECDRAGVLIIAGYERICPACNGEGFVR